MKTHEDGPPQDPTLAGVVAAAEQSLPQQADALSRARAFAEPLIAHETLDTGENMLAHADAVAAILARMGGSEAMQAASYLVYACPMLARPQEAIARGFGESYADLAVQTNQLVAVQRQAASGSAADQAENVRKMLLAFSRDLRVVMLRLASRLQTLRWFAAQKRQVSEQVARESLEVFSPLANRLGIWQVKWELEDLAFRALEPDTYKQVARLLDEKRVERETYMAQLRREVEAELRAQGLQVQVAGRPKHIFSIVKKMRGKSLDFDRVFDVRALRVIVREPRECYAALAWVHQRFEPVEGEFDDYIARPKPNGYQSLHTVVRDKAGRPIEIQIRTQAMHEHAEHGVAAHWAYKEAGTKGYAGIAASSAYDAKIAVLRQLLAWERDIAGAGTSLFADRIYVLTPQATVVELTQGSTAVDFAYSVHTNLGHRCRGARVDGALVTLSTPLKNGQTVEVVTAKEGGPSRDWLNPELGFLASPRAKSKVRAWFNEQARHETVARGREAVEKLLQREGRTAFKLEDLADQLGFKAADDLFAVVGKDEFSLRTIETLLRPAEAPPDVDEVLLKKSRAAAGGASPKGGVLVVGIDSLMTQLARCCKPAPPDAISGFVTRGKGVSIHRADCSNFRQMAARQGERVIQVEWGRAQAGPEAAIYPVDVSVEAADRQGLLRDISDVFAKEKMNVVGVQTQSVKGTAFMTFTIEVADASRLGKVLSLVREVTGVRSARRR
ncbi:MAG: bifunctional (p)ppGpp synthetase/guanosine-3',5'-bis(diphosphate) 3'-pyrophosphohydrolase [Ramlibacter sp.]|uniref:RelA/SpoT family protein n=1 Tax=Ramlibacter sp. TaxID=1917967 RepID=UPI00262AD2C7|nr:bifunctional (p)ppGpp synthetase/guanosine-3',5'-bis(diphosphate) 3'-pyrophosphohydrolase [Ramlibacter sp.]MDH4374841.1 bifunctional (p)ppGpp synthetase/guanosine-3',5'-bis(diphosphate) 3'-pyrophosphohydrolase [Ramlibacter sp.]